MNNNVVYKIYLALELTKIYISIAGDSLSKEGVAETFTFYVQSLSGIEDLPNVDELKKELESTKHLYNDLRENMESIINEKVAYKKDVLAAILENAKGDMEPYVYQSLQKLIK